MTEDNNGIRLIKGIPVSARLAELLDQLANSFITTAQLVAMVKNQASEEGLTKEQTRELIVVTLRKRQIKNRQIYRLLPPELKNKRRNGAIKRLEYLHDFQSKSESPNGDITTSSLSDNMNMKSNDEILIANGGESINFNLEIQKRDAEIQSWKNRAKANQTALNEILCNIKETPAFKEQAAELELYKMKLTQLEAVKEGGSIKADKINAEHEIRLNIRDNFNKLRVILVNQKSPWAYMKVNLMGEVTEICGEQERT